MYKVAPTFEIAIKENGKLITYISKKVCRETQYKHVPYEEVKSVITMAAWFAWKKQNEIKNQDGETPHAFGTYIYNYRHNAFKAFPELNYSSGAPPDETIEDMRPSGVDNYIAAESCENMLNKLQPKEKEVLTKRFFESRTQTEIADEMGVTKERIGQISRSGLSKLKDIHVK